MRANQVQDDLAVDFAGGTAPGDAATCQHFFEFVYSDYALRDAN